MMTFTKVFKTTVTTPDNSPHQDYLHQDSQNK